METLERVKEKIAKNMPKSRKEVLKWKRISKYTLQSECKRFTVGKVILETELTYEAWHFKTMLGVRLKSAEEAKLLCESHLINLKNDPQPMTTALSRQLAEEKQKLMAGGR